MNRVKRNERIGVMMNMLVKEPNKIFSLSYFTDLFMTAKSTISDDIGILKDLVDRFELGRIETVIGASGGVIFLPQIFQKDLDFIKDMCTMLSQDDRMLPGGFIYINDIIFNPKLAQHFGDILAAQFYSSRADFVITVETKGIPIAMAVGKALSLPVVIARRESRLTEGSTVSINYVSASSNRIQTMSLVKKSVKEGQRGLIIDDFMRGGGTVNGLIGLLNEFEADIAGIGVIMSTEEPQEKLISEYSSLIELKKMEEKPNKFIAEPTFWLKNLEKQ